MKRVIPLLIVTLLAACAPTTQRPGVDSAAVEAERLEQQKLAVRQGLAQYDQLQRVSFRLSSAGAPLCGDEVRPRLGFWVLSMEGYKEDMRAAARSVLGAYPDTALIIRPSPDSPAARAGLKDTDTLISVNGAKVGRGDFQDALVKASAAGPVTLTVSASGIERQVTVTPVNSCKYPADITKDAVINAYADGDAIHVTKGMMDFIKSDEELALVIGHEMAHDFRGHIAAKRGNAIAGQVLGTILDVLAAAGGVSTGGAFGNNMGMMAAGAFSQDFENEADYAGLYVMARAGYPIDGAPDFWRRMAIANPDAITMARSHPTTPERFVALKADIDEIKAKIAKGEPLVPNEKPKSDPVAQKRDEKLPGLSQ